LESSTERLSIATLFGSVIFVSKVFLPSPFDKMVIVVHAVFLGLSSLMLKRFGATYVAAVGGILTALYRPAFAPFTLSLALLYGLFVDCSFYLLKVNSPKRVAKTGRIVISMTLSTGLIGFLGYYASTLFELLPRNPVLEASLLAIGTINGAIAGYLVSVLWNKHLKNTRFLQNQP